METIEAVITKVVLKKGYVVTKPRTGIKESVTFTLSKEVWISEIQPRNGMIIMLENIYRTEQGLRANKASPKAD